MSDAQTAIEGWAILELFGHNKIAGYLTTVIIGTSGMFRVDVPELDDAPGYTRLYGPGAVYSLTLVTEDIVRAALKAIRPEAVTVYIPRERQLPEFVPCTPHDDSFEERRTSPDENEHAEEVEDGLAF